MHWAWYIVIALAAAAFLFWFVWFSNNKIQTTRLFIKAENAPEKGLKIAHISDLHGKTFGRDNCVLLDKILAERPDMICITGDVIHKYRRKDIAVAFNFVSACSAVAPVYYVSGNHEMRSTYYREFRKQLMAAGATVLDDRGEEADIFITGVNCASLKKGTAEKIAPPQGKFSLLLAHMPHFFQSYARGGYDLVLCGHAHGGQWRVPFTRIGIYAPGQGFLPKYTSGVYKSGKTAMVVSRGLGNSECPLRLFNRPELVVVEIEKE